MPTVTLRLRYLGLKELAEREADRTARRPSILLSEGEAGPRLAVLEQYVDGTWIEVPVAS